MMFDLRGDPRAVPLRGRQALAYAMWMDDGRRIAAYDWPERVYRVIDVETGAPLATLAREADGPPTIRLSSTRDGTRVFVVRRGGDYWFHDLALGQPVDFPAPPGQHHTFVFSPDGQHVVFNHLTFEGSLVLIANADGSDAGVLWRSTGGAWIAHDAWSPDGLLLVSEQSGGLDAPVYDYVVIDREATTVWRWSDAATPVGRISLQWAGASRLLAKDERAAYFIDIASGRRTDAAAELADTPVTFSPDGEHAIMRDADGTCTLVQVDEMLGTVTELVSVSPDDGDPDPSFCRVVDWTPDGSRAVVSAGGGN
jgi:hypothetical protein